MFKKVSEKLGILFTKKRLMKDKKLQYLLNRITWSEKEIKKDIREKFGKFRKGKQIKKGTWSE